MRTKKCACVLVSVLLALCITANSAPPDLQKLATTPEDLTSSLVVTMPRKPANQVTTIQPEHKLARPSVLSPPEMPPSKPAKQVTTNQPEEKLARPSVLSPPEKPTSTPEEVTTSTPEYVCQRRPLIVKFADLGWSDYILAPNDYDAGYCSGECLPQNLPNATSHAIIQALVNKLQGAVPRPCCVPTELEPVDLLYFSEENNIVLRNYPNMKVKSCGCR